MLQIIPWVMDMVWWWRWNMSIFCIFFFYYLLVAIKYRSWKCCRCFIKKPIHINEYYVCKYHGYVSSSLLGSPQLHRNPISLIHNNLLYNFYYFFAVASAEFESTVTDQRCKKVCRSSGIQLCIKSNPNNKKKQIWINQQIV